MSHIIALRKTLRLIGQYATPILMVTALVAAPGRAIAGTTNTIPFDDTFESYTNGTPLIDGTNGWYGSSNDIIVQTNVVCTNYGDISTKAAMIPVDGALSNRFVSTNIINVQIQMDMKVVLYNVQNPPLVETNGSSMFYVNSNGYFVVHNGAPSPSPINSVNWVTLRTNVAGQAITPIAEGAWIRVLLHQNYMAKTWALYTNNVLLAEGIGFINPTLTNFTWSCLYNGNSTSYLDNVHVSKGWASLAVSPTNINHEIWQGQAAGSNLVEVWNTNETFGMTFSNTVSYTNCGIWTNWLTVTPAAGTSYGEHQNVWVGMITTNLPPRTNAYEGAVQVTAPEATNSPQMVRVTVRVLEAAKLGVSPTNFTKELTEGQVTVGDVIKVANTSAAPRGVMSYTVTTTNTWLSVSPPTGNVQDDTNDVNIGYDTTGLAAGWYTGRVDVVALGVGTQAVAVVLRLNHRPGVAWDAGSKVWTNEVMAGGSIAGTTIEVWNASATPRGHMNYQLSVLNDSFGWVSVSPASGVSTGDHQVATVSYTTTGLVAGVYTAQLKLAGVDAATGQATTNGPLYMGLQLTVKGTPVLKTDVTSLSQTVLENLIGITNFLVWNEGSLPRGGMRYTVTPDVSWVTVIPATGVVTNNIDSVQVASGTTGTTLPPGVYQGNLVVDAFDAQTSARAGGAPLTIPLTLTVTPRTPTNLELPTVVGTLFIGQTVAANVGLWQNQERLTFGYQWERASDKAGAGREVLSGAVGTNYVITEADCGKYLRVDVTATDPEPFPKSSTAYSAWENKAKVKALSGDFNGDGITDLWFYDEFSGTWHMSFGATDSVSGIFGGLGMVAVPGDYDGDGNEDAGVYNWAYGMWHILFLPRGDYVYGSLFGGTVYEAEATPMPADYDGDRATDVAFYWNGYWAILYSSLGVVSVVDPFAGGGVPVSGDWDGNGVEEMGVYADGVWTLRLGNGSVVVQEFGGGGDTVLPALGDFDGDSTTDLGVYDVSVNQWRWRESRTGFEKNMNFGRGGLVPMPGYYDHDCSNDWAQVSQSDDYDFIVWEVKRTTETNFLYRGQSYQQSTDRWRVSW